MIHFDHYTIRPLVVEDLEKYYDLIHRNRKRLEDFFSGTVSKTLNLEATKDYLEEITIKRVSKLYFPYIVVDNTTDLFVGFFDLKKIDWNIPNAEMGCFTDEHFAGKGITTKAMKHFIHYCFVEFAFNKLILRTHASNKAACLLAEHSGFEIEGHIRLDHKKTSGELVDLVYYGLIRPHEL